MSDHRKPQAPQEHSSRRLYRRMDDRMIAGVAAGVADYFNVDPTFVRIAFVLLALLGGAGIVAYLVAWWLVPPAVGTGPSAEAERGERRLDQAPAWIAMVLIIFGSALLLSEAHLLNWDIAWGLAIISLGVLLFLRARDRGLEEQVQTLGGAVVGAAPSAVATLPRTPSAPMPSPLPEERPPPSSPEAPTVPLAPSEPLAPLAPAPPTGTFEHPAPAFPPPPRRRRERSRLGWGTLGLALLATGVAALLDALDVIGLSLAQYLALPVAVIGAGLFVGAWRGRARWLLVPGFLLLPLLLLASLVDVPLEGGFASRHLVLVSAEAAEGPHRLVGGSLTIDLTELPLDGSTVPVTASVAAGELRVLVPQGVRVVTHARAGVGAMWLLGSYTEGAEIEDEITGGPADQGSLQLDLAVSFGRIVVERVVQPGNR